MTNKPLEPPHWGKLSSLTPGISSLSLIKAVSPLQIRHEKGKILFCQMYQQDHDKFFIKRTGKVAICIENNNYNLEQNEAYEVHSGDKITLTIGTNMTIEYVFSSSETQRNPLKRNRDQDKENIPPGPEKHSKLQRDLEKEGYCSLCQKLIYECATIIPCLHSFCMYCITRSLKLSQTCPECGQHVREYRKNVFLNNLLEAYEESGFRNKNVKKLTTKSRKKISI